MKPRFDVRQLEQLNPRQREAALEALATLDEQREQNPLFYYNHPILSAKKIHLKQLVFHAMQQPLRVFEGGNQSGKTTAGLVDDIVQVCDWEVVPEHLHFVKKYNPPCYVRILTTDMVTLELTVYQKLRELFPKSQLYGGKWERAFNQQQRVLRLKNGSLIQFMTYKQEVSSMGGATLHRVHYDEEPPRDVAEENRIRVMRQGGDEILTMTPLQGLSWTFEEIYEKVARDEYEVDKDVWETEDTGMVLVDMDDNPYLTEEAKRQTLRGYSPEVIEARKRGKYVHFAGLIYAEFDKHQHTLDDSYRDNINDSLNVVIGIDPGIRNRCAVVWVGLDHTEHVYVFDELYEQGATIAEVAQKIKLINAQWGVAPIYYVIDPAGRNKNFQTGRSDQMEFIDHGIVTIAGQHDVEAGINRIKERLRNQKLHIFQSCQHTIREFEKYRWKDPPRTGEDGKPQPVKVEDHLMDALRYVVMSRPYLPEYVEHIEETRLQRIMREDRERYDRPTPQHEFGGIFN